MALNYTENIIHSIKKGEVTYEIQDAVAKAAIELLQSSAETEGSVAKAAADAQAAAESTAATALSTKVGNIGEGTVKAYVDDAITTLSGTVEEHSEVTAAALTDLDSRISTLDSGAVKSVTEGATNGTVAVDGTDVAVHGLGSAAYTNSTDYDAAGTAADAIAALDATVSQTAGTDGLALSITEADGVITAISGSIAAKTYDAYGAAATAKSEVIGAGTDATSAETIHGAKNYAKDLVDKILGEDSASTTLASLKAVIAELNDPANAGGITGTFVDTVKADLAGLTKTVGNEQVHATVKEYVDNAVAGATSSASSAIAALDAEVTSSDGTNVQVKVTEVDGKITAVNVTTDNTVNSSDVSSAISTAINALDATPSQTAAAANGQLALSLTQVDGVVTGISGSIAANTYDAYGAASGVQTTVIGASGDASTANTIYGAKAYADAAVASQTQSRVENGVLILGL